MPMRRMLILMIAVIGMFGSDAFAIYAPSTGRFMQRDPIGSMNHLIFDNPARSKTIDVRSVWIAGSTRYEYTKSSPVRYVDPGGLAPTGGQDSTDWKFGRRDSRGNCYRYACNDPTVDPSDEHQETPGGPANLTDMYNNGVTCKKVMDGAKDDGLLPCPSGKCPSGTSKVAAVVRHKDKSSGSPGDPGYDPGDYHWYVEGDDGTWWHKPGFTPEINTVYLAPGEMGPPAPLTNPEDPGQRGGYTEFCGYLCVPSGGINVD